MTAHHFPGGPLWQPTSRSGVPLAEDMPVAYWGPDLPPPPMVEQPSTPTLAEWIDKNFEGFWERSAGGVS